MSQAPGNDSASALIRAADQGRLGDIVPATSPARAELDAAAARYTRPLQVQVCGRAGTGRDTLARALREQLSITAIGPGEADEGYVDADLWMYLLTGPPRGADHRGLAALPGDRTIVVLGKADVHGDPEEAELLAARCAQRIRQPVHAVSPLLACADLRDDEFAFLRRLVAAGAEMPSMAGHFLTDTIAGRPTPAGAPPFLGDERALRAGLLRRVDQYGIDRALTFIADGRPAGADVAALNLELRAMGRMAVLLEPVRRRVEQVRYWRAMELRAAVARIAARGHDRDAIEHLLAGELTI